MRKLLVSFFCVGRLAALCAAAGMPAIDPRVPPLFAGHVMTNETVLFMGTDDAAPLMYKADRILSVTSFDLKTNYVEGVDWTFDAATHTIRPTPNTRMPYYKESEWYPAKGRFRCNRPGKPFVFFSEGSVISLHQVCVTYSHSDAWDGPVPRGDAAAFAPLLARLSTRTGGKTLFYGDSITTGGNSSGKVGFDPHIPSWPEQVHAEIAAATGNSGLEYVNTAVGGKNSQWGVDNVKARVIDHAPDFVLIAFGMNDSMPANAYSAKTAAMVDAIHAALPQTAVLLVPPMEPNPEAKGFAKGRLFAEYERALCALAEKFRAAGFARIGCANVNTMHAAVLARKRYRDMTGNNINHCNDFSARIYRDAILAAMGILPIGCE
ncbi:MAG: SGNH/GDSL hydrolase family protein [Kiritimatiellae bacterium]|nr:SGNH/GDSL hydrolase family protein [Kiritimatiellia bacterium]